MAGSLGEIVYTTDKAIFNWLQETMLAEWLGEESVYLGNVYFWTPFFIFLGAMMLQAKRSRAGWNVFFALGTVIVAYQAAFLLSMFLRHPAPYYFAIKNEIVLPAFRFDVQYSLPDWPMTTFFALFTFINKRLRKYRSPLPIYVWLAVPLFVLFRLLPGYAFPIDLLTSIVLGHLIAFPMIKLAEGVDVILDGDEAMMK